MSKGGLAQEVDEEDGGDDPRKFRMEFPTKAVMRPCPVEGCSIQAGAQTSMKVHLWHRNVRYTVVILEEGNLPHPPCPLCYMLVP